MYKKSNLAFVIAAVAISGIHAVVSYQVPADKAELGKMLFFDPILSENGTISCASCHKPDFAFADTSAVSPGVHGRKGTRNTPSAMNVVLAKSFFWDGRAKTLEDQALMPIENKNEMDLPVEKALLRLKNNKKYNDYFEKLFNSEPTRSNLASAIAAYERTLETNNSPFDEWKFSGDSNAVDEEVKKGFTLFNGKAQCIKCHFGADLTANEFRNIGLFNGQTLNDSGRALISGAKDDLGKFKTASLRNVARTAPYMHNGMFKTLEEVVDFYNDPGKVVANSINRDSLMSKPLGLTVEEKKNIVSFLKSLTDIRFECSLVKKYSFNDGN
jgi:cytochrome c peroxidase